ncbi:hypothetical protein [Larkinella sp. C7]|uniref:hypothetical protein n=1 Tax=Larkinella sp. C7 TaxID=2576607 RepID=UPI00111101E7|nr:hypothetical protein [Larkinella sp. C7]
MPSLVTLYQQEMHGNVGFFANWFPGDPLEIGDVGLLENGRFRRLTTLKELNIECISSEGQNKQEMQYTSTQGTNVKASLGGALTAGTKGEITIDFSREGAFVFNASGLTTKRMENRLSVGNQILDTYEKKNWERNWVVIESLYVADCATIIVSEDHSSSIVLQASADIPIPSISLSDPKLDLKVTSTRGKLIHIVGEKGLHPLYACFKLKDTWFSQPAIHPVRGASARELPLSRVNIYELLSS